MAKNEKVDHRFRVKRQADVAEFFGVAPGTVKDWTARKMPGRTGAYDLDQIAKWLRKSGPWAASARVESDDPLLAGDGESPGLERYRLAKAALAELELEERLKGLLSRDKARSIFGRWASVIRRLGERLGTRYGGDAAGSVNDALRECEDVIGRELGSGESGDGEPADDCAP